MRGERLPASYANFYIANGVVIVSLSEGNIERVESKGDKAGRAPWVRWPPASSDRPRMVSPGLVSASITAPFA